MVCVELRGFCAFGGTSGAFGGGIVLLGGRVWSVGVWSVGVCGGRSSFPHFGKLGGFCGV